MPPQQDVGTAPGHVGRDRDRAESPGLRDDLGLLFVVLGVEDVVVDLLLVEHPAEGFGLFDAGRADQHGLTPVVALDDLFDDGVELLVVTAVDDVVVVLPDDRFVGRDGVGVEVVELLELLLLGLGRPGHAGQLVVHPEEVLEGDRRQRLVLVLDRDALFGLDRLVESVGPAPPRHRAAGEFVDDDDLAVADDVLIVLLVEGVGLEGLVDVVEHLDVVGIVEVVDPESLLDLLDATVREGHRAVLLVDEIVVIPLQIGDDVVDFVVELGRLVGLAADDQGRARLVDQDRVDLVDDPVVEIALDHLVVGPVGDVGPVGLLPLVRPHVAEDRPDFQAEEPVDVAHPLGVSFGQVVVDRNQVTPLLFEGVQIEGHRRHERLALTGLHLADVALVEADRAHQLDVEVAHPQGTLADLSNRRKGLVHDVVEVGPAIELLLELRGLGLQLLVGFGLHVGLELVDALDVGLETAEVSIVFRPEDLFEDVEHNRLVASWELNGRRRRHTNARHRRTRSDGRRCRMRSGGPRNELDDDC